MFLMSPDSGYCDIIIRRKFPRLFDIWQGRELLQKRGLCIGHLKSKYCTYTLTDVTCYKTVKCIILCTLEYSEENPGYNQYVEGEVFICGQVGQLGGP